MLRELSALGLTKVSRTGIAPILLITFDSELYSWTNTVNMIQNKFFMDLLLNDPCVIHKPIPKPRGWEADMSTSLSKCSMYKLATIGLTGGHIAAPSICS